MVTNLATQIVLGIIYNEVAKKLGVICELVYSPETDVREISLFLRYRTGFSE